jgi:long-chain acyl-CoA synthetase
VIMYKWDPERALELIERERVTNFVGVPTHVVGHARVTPTSRRDTSSLRPSAAAARRRRPSS